VTGEAGLVLHNRRCKRFFAERAIWLGSVSQPLRIADVSITVTMTTGASGCALVSNRGVSSFTNSQHRIRIVFIMAACAFRITAQNHMLGNNILGDDLGKSNCVGINLKYINRTGFFDYFAGFFVGFGHFKFLCPSR
jgi:hypothetical protein